MIEYPKDYSENVKFRRDLIVSAAGNKSLQSDLIESCKRDRLFFFNVFAWTYNPRKAVKHLPFITYKYQDNTIIWDAECAQDQVDNIVEKSRDMGATWIFVINDFYDWLFFDEKIEIRWGSRKEDYVDKKGDMDSIFEKFRYLYRELPNWMLPKGFNAKEHDNHMRLINPETGSSITGESTNANFGRGGRKYRIRFDEFAFWEMAEAAWSSCADSTNCRTALSTPNGSSNRFALLAKDNKIRRQTLHWTLHPEKNIGAYYFNDGEKIPVKVENAFNTWLQNRDRLAPEPLIGTFMRSVWYDKECERRQNAKEVAQELDIDYHMSGSPFFDIRALKRQLPWTELVRDVFDQSVPHGRFVRANPLEIDHKWGVKETSAGWLKVFEYPKPNGQYIVSGDTAEGLEKGDESVGIVRDKYTLNVVASFNGTYTPDDHAYKLFQVAKLYNNAKVAPENNNHGYSVISDLKEMDCDLYWTLNEDGKPVKPGFTTSPKSRPKALDQAAEEISKQACELRDPDLISQCETFINNPRGKPEADGGFLDDLVMAFAISSYVLKEYPYQKPKEKPRRVITKKSKTNAGISFS